jgi:hypothetical protein
VGGTYTGWEGTDVYGTVDDGCVVIVELVVVTIGGNIYVVLPYIEPFPPVAEVLTTVVSIEIVPLGYTPLGVIGGKIVPLPPPVPLLPPLPPPNRFNPRPMTPSPNKIPSTRAASPSSPSNAQQQGEQQVPAFALSS